MLEKWILWLLVALFLIGCGTSTKRLALESEYMRTIIETGQPVETIKTADLTDEELLKLTQIGHQFNTFLDKYDDPLDVLKDGSETLERDYDAVRESYKDLYVLVRNNWHEYTPEDQALLREWDTHARLLDGAAISYKKMEKWLEMKDQAVKYTRIGVKLLITKGIL